MPTPTPTLDWWYEFERLAAARGMTAAEAISRIERGEAISGDVANAYYVAKSLEPTPAPTPTPTSTPGLPWELAAKGGISPQPTALGPAGKGTTEGSNMEAILAVWNAAMATPTPTATPGPTPTPGFTPPPTTTPWPTYAPTAVPPTATPWPTYAPTATNTPWPTATATPSPSPTATSPAAPTPSPTPTVMSPAPRADLTTAYNPTPAASPTPTPATSYAGVRGPIPATQVPLLEAQFAYQKGVVPAPPVPPYEYPEATSGRGSVGNFVGEVLEYYTTASIESQSLSVVRMHSELYDKYNSLLEGFQKQAVARDLAMLEGQYDQLVAAAQTAGAAPRALGTLTEYPSLYSDWEGLKGEFSGGLGLTLPPLAGRITPPLGDIGTTPGFLTREATPPVVPEFTDLTQYLQPQSVMQTPQTDSSIPGLAQRGGMGMFNPTSQIGSQPPAAGNVPEGGGGGVETPGGRGFASWGALEEGMGDDWQPWLRDQYTGAVIRGGTNMIRGSAGQLREHIGDTTPFGYYRGGRDEGYYDLGQGEQKYIIRRDGMGNIRSFTPASSGQMPWDRFVSSG